MGDGEMSRRNPRDRRVKMLRLWLRGLRKMSRQEEDAKKRMERFQMNLLGTMISWAENQEWARRKGK